jgi:hypothetical protein
MPCFANNVFISGINSVGPPNINVRPSLPFHLSHFLFSHSSRVIPRVQKFNRYTKKIMFKKMRGGVSKEKVETLAR